MFFGKNLVLLSLKQTELVIIEGVACHILTLDLLRPNMAP